MAVTFSALRAGRIFTTRKIPATHFCRGWIDSGATVRMEELGQLKTQLRKWKMHGLSFTIHRGTNFTLLPLTSRIVTHYYNDPEVWVRFSAQPHPLRSSGPGTGSTQLREYNWGAAAVGICHADHAAPSIHKIWHQLCRYAAAARSA
jgi:hypothetical protein